MVLRCSRIADAKISLSGAIGFFVYSRLARGAVGVENYALKCFRPFSQLEYA